MRSSLFKSSTLKTIQNVIFAETVIRALLAAKPGDGHVADIKLDTRITVMRPTF